MPAKRTPPARAPCTPALRGRDMATLPATIYALASPLPGNSAMPIPPLRSSPRLRRMVCLFAALLGCAFAPAGAAQPPAPERRAALSNMVRQDCGSCHGMTLQGGLGPALLPSALADKPAQSLVATILGGRAGTPMPPWHGFLAEDDAKWIVDRLISGFPE